MITSSDSMMKVVCILKFWSLNFWSLAVLSITEFSHATKIRRASLSLLNPFIYLIGTIDFESDGAAKSVSAVHRQTRIFLLTSQLQNMVLCI